MYSAPAGRIVTAGYPLPLCRPLECEGAAPWGCDRPFPGCGLPAPLPAAGCDFEGFVCPGADADLPGADPDLPGAGADLPCATPALPCPGADLPCAGAGLVRAAPRPFPCPGGLPAPGSPLGAPDCDVPRPCPTAGATSGAAARVEPVAAAVAGACWSIVWVTAERSGCTAVTTTAALVAATAIFVTIPAFVAADAAETAAPPPPLPAAEPVAAAPASAPDVPKPGREPVSACRTCGPGTSAAACPAVRRSRICAVRQRRHSATWTAWTAVGSSDAREPAADAGTLGVARVTLGDERCARPHEQRLHRVRRRREHVGDL